MLPKCYRSAIEGFESLDNTAVSALCMETVGVEPTSRDTDYLSVYERSLHIRVSLIFLPAGWPSES